MSTINRRSWLSPTFFILATIFLSGCSDSGRIPIKGVVSVDGSPIQKGYIHFCPMPGTSGPTAGADIVNGVYEINPKKGVFEGKFRVEIKDWRESKKRTQDVVTGETFSGVEQFLPPRFNSESELTVEIKRGGDGNDFNLEL